MRTLILSFLLVSSAAGQPKQLCVTVDDLPVVAYGVTDTTGQRGIMEGLVQGLAEWRVPAVGFVNEQRLYGRTGLLQFQVSLVEQWLDGGLELGNHTCSHPDFNTFSCEAFFADVVRGETVTKRLLQHRGKSLRYFRHPFLHTGPTKAKADSLSMFLAGRGYTIAPVTVDTDDYLFAVAYHRAAMKHDTALSSRIGRDYVAYMEEKLMYFERQSVRLFGRPIAQVLLVHASRLNADHMGALLAMCRRNGYTFAPLHEVLQDRAYSTPVTVYGRYGISWLDRWALSQGKSGEFFRDEPGVPLYITGGDQ